MQAVTSRSAFWFGAAVTFSLAAGGVLAQSNFPPFRTSQRITLPMPRPSSAPAIAVPPNVATLVFDQDVKEYNAKPFETKASFTFHVTNAWTNAITINNVKPSCGCTTANMPHTPWVLQPGEGGLVDANINLAGKMGSITKTLQFFTTVGARVATLKVNIPAPPSANAMSAMDRKAAMAQAAVDPQAIFKGDCVSCHVEKGRTALGEALYVADCGICHESSHRESIVPDLHALKTPTNFEYWKNVIVFGKAHTLMPAFAISQGGPLTDQQVLSLAGYLSRVLSHNVPLTPMTNAASAHGDHFAAVKP